MEAEDPAVVHDAVDDRGGHVPVAEHVAPSAGLEVRGGDDALACEHADRDGQVGLAAAHVAVEHEVLGPARVLLLEQVGQEAELAGRGVLQGLPGHAVCQRQVAGEAHDLFRRGLVKNAAAALPWFLLAHSASFMYLS